MDPKTWKQWNIWNAAAYIITRGARQYCQGRFSGRFWRGQARGKVAPWKMAECTKEKGIAQRKREKHEVEQSLYGGCLLSGCCVDRSGWKNIVDILFSQFQMSSRYIVEFVMCSRLCTFYGFSFTSKLCSSGQRNCGDRWWRNNVLNFRCRYISMLHAKIF